MSKQQTTKLGKTAGGQKITTGSPTGHEELAQHTAVEQKGDAEVPETQPAKRNPPVHLIEGENPKRTSPVPRTKD